jgi:hypothetical protein
MAPYFPQQKLLTSGEFVYSGRGLFNGLAGVGLDLLGLVLQCALDVDGLNVLKADESEDSSQIGLLKVVKIF